MFLALCKYVQVCFVAVQKAFKIFSHICSVWQNASTNIAFVQYKMIILTYLVHRWGSKNISASITKCTLDSCLLKCVSLYVTKLYL